MNDIVGRKKLRVIRIIQESSDTKSFILQPVEGTIQYRSGQFLTFIATTESGREIRRSYSMSSSPELGELLTVTVKRIPNGEFSRKMLDRTRPGDELETIGASGFFVLPENLDIYNNIVFFAAGSGITPVFALLKTLLHRFPFTKAFLFYSSRSAEETIFHEDIQSLQEKFSGKFTMQYLFSNSPDLSTSRLTPENLEFYLKHFKINPSRTLFYVCGPGNYMRMISFTLISLGFPARTIKREIFYIQQPAVVPAPEDTRPHHVKLIKDGKEIDIVVQYPVTILQAAKLLNIDLPFSCETGQCGTCVAKCLHGKVWMTRNEVLLDEEIADGLILTCTGYPIRGDVTLSF